MKCGGTGGGAGIEPPLPMLRRGPAAGGPSGVAWRRTPPCVTRGPPSSRTRGRLSKSPPGSARRILTIRVCTCPTRRSISACSSKAAACSQRRCKRSCASGTRCGGRARRRRSQADTSSARSRFGSARPPLKTARVPGHWEGDLLVGARQSYVATLVERRSRYVCLVRVAGRETRTVVQALTQHVRQFPDGLMATLTWDRGLELAAHRTVSIATGVQVYFCDPYSPWQRGTNENTNGLLRQYLPEGD